MNKLLLKAALTRCIKTMAQTAASIIAVGATGIFDVDWIGVLSASVLAGILSLLTSIAGLPEVTIESKEELDPEYFEPEPEEEGEADE